MNDVEVWIEDRRTDGGPGGRRLRGRDLKRVWTGHRLDDVVPALEQAEAWADSGGWSIGFLTYEAAPALDPNLTTHPHDDDGALPLFWWAAFEGVEEIPTPAGPLPTSPELADLQWRPGMSAEAHRRTVDRVRQSIAAGDTYQVNLTFPMRARTDLDPRSLIHLMTGAQQSQRAGFGAYLATDRWAVASASPELFFRLQGDHLVARPMKGTSPRGRWNVEDQERRRELQSEKNRAENLMILDMMRNDLGRVAEPSSVRVTRLFGVETYPTVHQLVSQVEARTHASRVDILRALFPCASITGAPKARTSELIRDLEPTPRGLYTGTVGYFAPCRRARMSVAIRTAVVDRRRKTMTYGTGGGIVWDSRADEEYREALVKTRILSHRRPPFDLLETLLWRPSTGYFLLDRHLDRLRRSAAYFDRPIDLESIRRVLDSTAKRFQAPSLPHKIRLLVDAGGRPRCQADPLPREPRRPWTLGLDRRPIDDQDPFLFHKTTARQVYEQASARRPDVDETALWNTRSELTETPRGNLVLRFGGELLTPPIECGLLAGTLREALLARGRLQERALDVSDLRRADAIYLINSVRGWVPLIYRP